MLDLSHRKAAPNYWLLLQPNQLVELVQQASAPYLRKNRKSNLYRQVGGFIGEKKLDTFFFVFYKEIIVFLRRRSGFVRGREGRYVYQYHSNVSGCTKCLTVLLLTIAISVLDINIISPYFFFLKFCVVEEQILLTFFFYLVDQLIC